MIESQEERYNVVTSNLWIHNHNQQVRVSHSIFFFTQIWRNTITILKIMLKNGLRLIKNFRK